MTNLLICLKLGCFAPRKEMKEKSAEESRLEKLGVDISIVLINHIQTHTYLREA